MRNILFTISLMLTASLVFAQGVVTSQGGRLSSGGVYQQIGVVGDPAASSQTATGGNITMYVGFVPANFITSSTAAGGGVNKTDSLALVAFYKETFGQTWIDHGNWLVGPVADWFGVRLDGDRVAALELPENNLQGFIPDSLGLLTSMVALNLSNNALEKDIPAGVGDMQNLRRLNLSHNKLSGNIPPAVSNLTSLETLNLSNNELGGLIPKMHRMGFLEVIRLDSNKLRGNVPDSLDLILGLKELNVASNFLDGSIPASYGRLDSLVRFNIAGNDLTGAFPNMGRSAGLKQFVVSHNQLSGSLAFLSGFADLQRVLIQQNRFSVLPDLSSRAFTITEINVSENQLDFGDLEPNIILQNFTYAPQDSLGVGLDTLLSTGASIQFGETVAGSNNVYQWYKDGELQGDQDFDVFGIPAASAEDEGEYVLEITNIQVGDLTLHTQPFVISVSSRRRDSLSLVAVYEALDGDNWSNASSWLSGSLNDWEGVSFNTDGTRVEKLDLSNKGLRGRMPVAIRRIGNLASLDISNNDITRLPDMSGHEVLTELRVASNRLSFGDLVPNASIGTFDYAPQKSYGLASRDTVKAGSDVDLVANVPGLGNSYQWYFDTLAIAGATNPLHIVEEMDFFKMGSYNVQVKNANLPDLTLSTSQNQLLATDDVFGRVFLDSAGNPLPDGIVEIFRVKDGPFDSAGVSTLSENGDYILEDIILGDYVVKIDRGVPFKSQVMQTWYKSSANWVFADILELRTKTEGIDIVMIPNPGNFEPKPENTGRIGGVLEEEISDTDPGSRPESRRRVKKAACSLRRRTTGGGGRVDEEELELVAYVESDDEGNFEFSNIPDGIYLLNIQYPGVAMDESTAIEFEIGAGGTTEDNSFQLAAVITEEGIQVEVVEELYSIKPFLKDIVVYPNPTDGVLSFDYRVYRKLDQLQAELFDINGVRLMQQTISHAMGVQSATIDLISQTGGVYFMQLTDGGVPVTNTIKIIKK
ncbi:MAG: leucine-rich repeat domain-containing protein [Cyclobacteriaceae bacterium]